MPGMDLFIKKLPYLDSSYPFLHWIIIDIPVVILVSSMALDRVSSTGIRQCLAAAGLAGVVAVNVPGLPVPKNVLDYDPRPVAAGYSVARNTGKVPPVTRVKSPFDKPGRAVNDRFVDGTSPLPCYQPIFGPRLGRFPRHNVRYGPVIDPRNGKSAMFNPACYVFGKANKCRPGDYFRGRERDKVLAFTHYRKFPFAVPWWQHLAVYLSLVSFLLALAVLVRFAFQAVVAARHSAG
jgi:hypothetical protein